jgi:insulysin
VSDINALTREDMIEFFGYYISPLSPNRSKLAIHLYTQGGEGTPTPAEVVNVPENESKQRPYVIDNIRDFKSRLPLSTGPQPVASLIEFAEV